MKIIAQAILLLLVITSVGCDRSNTSSSGAVVTNLSVLVWPSFPSSTNSYRHLEHLTNLLRQANMLITINQGIFSQSQAHGQLTQDSPLRKLLNIPTNEPAKIDWMQSMDYRWIRIYSSNTAQRFGWIKLNLHTGAVEAAYDVEALFTVSEIEHRLRQIVGTREEALRLFGRRQSETSSPEQQQATKAVAEALLLPPDTKLYIEMSAPGGSNGGQGYLRIYTLQSNNQPAQIASVFYGIYYTSGNILTQILSELGLVHRTHSYRFGGPTLGAAWANLNTQGFALDTNGYPYPQIH
ncbi:MAG TPA: hypothetical protein VN836_12410 [Verrucomicrobiae bacterium]|nr:hypothetical protein [Verrucomicrobiae bacterium]